MTKKASKPVRTAPLQQFTVRPITDPAEQEALDERIKRSEAAVARGLARDVASGEMTAAVVLELCRQLSADERPQVVLELASRLSLAQQRELVERLTAQWPRETVRSFEERLGG